MSEEIKSWDDVEDQNLVSKIVTSQKYKKKSIANEVNKKDA